MTKMPQRIPTTGAAREALRAKGQFWTPEWIAEAMLAYVLQDKAEEVFDPAVGAGAFVLAAKQIAKEMGKKVRLSGNEIDREALAQAKQLGLTADDLAQVEIRDFLLHPPAKRFKAIVANPPYIRHHRLSGETKTALKVISNRLLGKAIDGRAGLHIYFLLQALELLDKGGRLAFIMPADTCEGIFAPTLWDWITRNYRLDAVIAFSPGASPFPAVDTNPVIFMLRNLPPETDFFWVQCQQRPPLSLKHLVETGFSSSSQTAISILKRQLKEALDTGLSRPPSLAKSRFILGNFANVMRGIATGANEFFFLTVAQAKALHLSAEFLIPAIGRTRDVEGDEITLETLARLDQAGRPTQLFAPDGRPLNAFPPAVQEYLKHGKSLKLDARPLIATRRPWYKMETRNAPPILFAYLGRRHIRFIRNTANVLPLTGFLCVYPHRADQVFLEKFWQVLQHPETLANLALVGKSYGDGAIKVEPRALEKLPLPEALLSRLNLQPVVKAAQLSLY